MELLFYPIIAGILCCIIFSIMGNIILWQRLSYYSDALTHCSLFGVIIHYITGLNLLFSVYVVAIIFSLLIKYLSNTTNRIYVTLVISQGILALAIISANLLGKSLNLLDFLIGDILLVSKYDMEILIILFFIISIWCFYCKKNLILISISRDLAKAHNVNVSKHETFFFILLSTTLAITVKIMGSLIVVAHITIPSAIAAIFAKTPGYMLIYTVIISIITFLLGFAVSFELDILTAPTIVSLNFLIFVIMKIIKINKSK